MSLQATAGDKCIFRERFLNVADVAANGGLVYGAPTINKGLVVTGVSTYVTNSMYGRRLMNIVKGGRTFTLVADVLTPSDFSSYRTICSIRNGSGAVVEIGYRVTDGTMYCFSSSTGVTTAGAAVPAGRHTLGYVFTGSAVIFYIDGVLNTTVSFTPTTPTTQTTLEIGQVGVAGQALNSTLYELRAYEGMLTADELLDIHQKDTITELDRPLIDLPLRNSYFQANGVQLLTDGDMEAADTSAWTASNVSLEKRTDTPYSGTQYMRVTRTGSSSLVTQTKLTVGKRYKYSIRMRGDGSGNPGVFHSAFLWQYGGALPASDYILVEGEFTALITTISIYPGAADGQYVDIDEFSVQLMEAQTENKGTLGGTAKLGDGSTTTTMPTQLYPHKYNFNGGAYIDFDQPVITNTNQPWTLVAHVDLKPVDGVADEIISNYTAVTAPSILVQRHFTNGFIIYIFSSTNNLKTSTFTYFVNTNLNGTLIVSNDGSLASGGINLYLNGIKQTVTSASMTGTLAAATITAKLKIGKDVDNTNYLSAGSKVNTLKIYNRELTPQQVSILHRQLMKSLNV